MAARFNPGRTPSSTRRLAALIAVCTLLVTRVLIPPANNTVTLMIAVIGTGAGVSGLLAATRREWGDPAAQRGLRVMIGLLLALVVSLLVLGPLPPLRHFYRDVGSYPMFVGALYLGAALATAAVVRRTPQRRSPARRQPRVIGAGVLAFCVAEGFLVLAVWYALADR